MLTILMKARALMSLLGGWTDERKHTTGHHRNLMPKFPRSLPSVWSGLDRWRGLLPDSRSSATEAACAPGPGAGRATPGRARAAGGRLAAERDVRAPARGVRLLVADVDRDGVVEHA